MKFALAVALILLTSTALAASPEEDYIAARDAFIAKFNPPGDPVAASDAATKEEERARAELTQQLRRVIGPLNVNGFTGEGTSNAGSLFRGELEFGILDGLMFTKEPDVRLVVTMASLAGRWVKSPEGLGEEGSTPPDLRTALKLGAFYTRAITADAAVGDYGELPVTKPAGADFVVAMLSGRRQDFFPVTPEEVLIGIIVPPRLYVVSMPAVAKIKVPAPCEKLWKDADDKASRMFEASEKAGKSENAVELADSIREKGEEAMRKCFATRAKREPAFTRIVKQAQEMVDTLAAR